MTNFEVEDALKSMEILVDTREQPTERARERFGLFSCPYRRVKLDYGDYSVNCTLPNGKLLYDSEQIYPFVAIERKMNLDELAMCFCKERKRFEAEFIRAKEHGGKIYLIVENASWENLIAGKYRSKFNSKAFLASILAWEARYGLQLFFCKSETTGKLIYEILYRELKEYLERRASEDDGIQGQ